MSPRRSERLRNLREAPNPCQVVIFHGRVTRQSVRLLMQQSMHTTNDGIGSNTIGGNNTSSIRSTSANRRRRRDPPRTHDESSNSWINNITSTDGGDNGSEGEYVSSDDENSEPNAEMDYLYDMVRLMLTIVASSHRSYYHTLDYPHDDELTFRIFSYFVRIAVLESPSLIQLNRRKPQEALIKIFRIVRFMFLTR